MRHPTRIFLSFILLSACTFGELPRPVGAPGPSPLVGPTREPSGRLAAAWRGLVFENGLVRPAAATTAGSDPEAAAQLVATGRHELAAGHAAAAIAAFTEAILAAPPDVPEPFVGLGQALLLVRERARAEAAFRTALALELGIRRLTIDWLGCSINEVTETRRWSTGRRRWRAIPSWPRRI